jgi:hypothetical protein
MKACNKHKHMHYHTITRLIQSSDTMLLCRPTVHNPYNANVCIIHLYEKISFSRPILYVYVRQPLTTNSC